MKNILTIAGYDPSSGAGITKDLDVFFSLRVHGLSVPTATVAQGPRGVEAVYPTPANQFAFMLGMAGLGMRIDGIKIGVVWDEIHLREIASFIKDKKNIPVVIDPVLRAKNETPLITTEGLRYLIDTIFPVASVVTPNIPEASVITGRIIENTDDMKEVAETICRMGPRAVVVKGGHMAGEPVDVLYDGRNFSLFQKRRRNKHVHGTGCTFSAALTAFLSHGYPLRESFLACQEYMATMLNESYHIDEKGYFYSSAGLTHSKEADRYRVISTLRKAGAHLTERNIVEFIPEVQLNVCYGIANASGIEDIAAFPGRIGSHEGRVLVKSEPRFGASSHVARMVLTFMKHYPWVRSCANVRFSEETIKKARTEGMDVILADGKVEPKPSEEWIGENFDPLVEKALQGTNHPPDIIYDMGDIGKEAIIRLFAEDPLKLIKKMEIIRT
ncbi:MAG: PfkB family carbohydrate kinase [Syntrophobacterales bacterium]|jgi:hydroxymethylpyrimidine/phosphomethylpyrimidine kinase|nr:PfkB family carbohydrate kinase [Syntrophobacterales bacterium]